MPQDWTAPRGGTERVFLPGRVREAADFGEETASDEL